jgi:hypothetical protein
VTETAQNFASAVQEKMKLKCTEMSNLDEFLDALWDILVEAEKNKARYISLFGSPKTYITNNNNKSRFNDRTSDSNSFIKNKKFKKFNKDNKDNVLHSKNDNSQTDKTCNACGREGHVFQDCSLREFHPDINKDENVEFKDSEIAKKWLLKNKTTVPFSFNLKGDKLKGADNYKKKSSSSSSSSSSNDNKNKSKLCTCFECTNNTHVYSSATTRAYYNDNLNHLNNPFKHNNTTITCFIIPRYGKVENEIKVEVLLDTGAISSNYLSVHIVDSLKQMEYYKGYNTSSNNKVCTAFEACTDLIGTIDCDLSIFNELIKNLKF